MVLRSLMHIYDVPAMMKQDLAFLFTSKLINIADQSDYVFRFSKVDRILSCMGLILI